MEAKVTYETGSSSQNVRTNFLLLRWKTNVQLIIIKRCVSK